MKANAAPSFCEPDSSSATGTTSVERSKFLLTKRTMFTRAASEYKRRSLNTQTMETFAIGTCLKNGWLEQTEPSSHLWKATTVTFLSQTLETHSHTRLSDLQSPCCQNQERRRQTRPSDSQSRCFQNQKRRRSRPSIMQPRTQHDTPTWSHR